MALGVMEEVGWESKTVKFDRGDTLLLYTDGVTDAQNDKDELFDEQRPVDSLWSSAGQPAQNVQDNVLTNVSDFVGDASQADDITLMVLVRDT